MTDFDYFSAELTCRNCHQTVLVAIQNDLQPGAHGVYLRKGDRVQLGARGPAEASYLTLHVPDVGQPIRLLEFWECSACGATNWAEVILDRDRIASIEGTLLSRATLDRVHFVASRLVFVYTEIVGVPLYEPLAQPTPTENYRLRPDWLQRLREGLPA